MDILYMTRVQRERFFNEQDYIRLKDSYILDNKKMELAAEDLIVLHPLPRVNEISVEVDDDPRACYFKQALCGKYIRMTAVGITGALLLIAGVVFLLNRRITAYLKKKQIKSGDK